MIEALANLLLSVLLFPWRYGGIFSLPFYLILLVGLPIRAFIVWRGGRWPD